MRGRALALVAALTLSGCGSFWPWSGPAKPKMPDPPPVTAAIASRVAWTVRVGASGVGFAPAVAAGAVFVASSEGQVTRIDPANGSVVWQVRLDKPLSGGVGSDGDTVVVAERDGTLIALGADGSKRWEVPLGGEAVTVPAVGQGVVVLRSSDNRIQAFDSDTGKRRWSFQRQLPPLVLRQTAGIAMAPGTAYIGLPGGRLVALSLQSGAQRWEATVAQPRGATEIERISDIVGSPIVSGRDVCAASYHGKLACFDESSGRPAWSRDVSSAQGLDVDARLVTVVDEGDSIHAYSRSGSSVWKQDALARRGLSAPLSLGPVVVVGDSLGLVYLVSRENGAIAGRFTTDGSAIVTAPVASGRLAIVQTAAGAITAIALE